ncbi:hypothetical protein JCM10207_001878 [Rhodosporidiobolus poonsookiae]
MSSSDLEKNSVHQVEEVALHGHVATDKYGKPLVQLDEAAEARLRRKIDLYILPMVFLIYIFCFIDRANIGNARLAGLEKDLKLQGYDYNILLTAFYVAYTVFEFPCQMINKWMGPGRSIPLFTFLFGLFSFAMAFIHTFGAAIAVRFLLGISEGAVFPGLALYLSRFYRRDELGFRLACYIVGAPLAGAFGGLLASGILKIDSIGWLTQWRNIFFVEGIITMGIGAISWFVLPDRPEKCRWLTEEEKILAEARIKSENVGQTDVVDSMHKQAIWDGVFNTTTLVSSLIFLLDNITVQGVGFFLPTIIRTLYPGRSTIYVQLMSVPPYITGSFTTLLVGYLSFKMKKRGLFMLLSAPFMVVGYAMYLATMDPQTRYAAAFMVGLGAFSFGSLCVTWSAANQTSDSGRAAAIGTTVFFGNCGGLISTWMFLAKDGPRYIPGNATNLTTSTLMFFLAGALWLWQIKENRAKDNGRDDHLLEGKTAEEIALLGQRHPAFRFAH